jgi:hypothetical protein
MMPLTDRRASGTAYTTGLGGELHEGQTLSCCHCQGTWMIEKGSGKVRGFCTRCMGYHCGGPTCWECVPVERRIENVEAGRPELTPVPASVVVPAGVELLAGG